MRQRERVALLPHDRRQRVPGRMRSLFLRGDAQLRGGEVQTDDLAGGADGVGEAKRDVAAAAADVDGAIPGSHARPLHRRALPDAMEAQR